MSFYLVIGFYAVGNERSFFIIFKKNGGRRRRWKREIKEKYQSRRRKWRGKNTKAKKKKTMKNWVGKQKSKWERLRVQTNVEGLPTLVGNNPWFQFQLIETKLETRLISKARTWVRTILGTGFPTLFGCETGPKIRTRVLVFWRKKWLRTRGWFTGSTLN